MTREIDRGTSLPIPCRHCGKFQPFRVEEVSVTLQCGACGKSTTVACRRKGADWIITTARVPNGNTVRRPTV